jgi:putative ABC transport system ATP-binding protein
MLIDLKNVYKIYGEGLESEVRALNDVSLQIDRGEFVEVVGSSGPEIHADEYARCLDIPLTDLPA